MQTSNEEGAEGSRDNPILVTGDAIPVKGPPYPDPSVGKRSSTYQFYTWNEKTNFFNCNKCKKSFSAKIGTLSNHISNKHPYLLKTSAKSLQTVSAAASPFVCISKPEPVTKEGFELRLIKFICSSAQPFSLVGEDGFKNLISYISLNNPNTRLPSERTLKRKITELYSATKEDLKNEINNSESKVSFVIDCWTSSNQFPFQGVIATWIDKSWVLNTRLIDLTELQGAHTGLNIADAFDNVLTDFSFWDKLLCVTTDNASNMDTMFTKLDEYAISKNSSFNSKEYRIRCLAHILNLVCQDIIKSASLKSYDKVCLDDTDSNDTELEDSQETGFLFKLRTSVQKIRSSPQRREVFKNQCSNLKVKHKNLVLDVKTRWNSTLDMLERSLEMKRPLELTLEQITKLRRFSIDPEEWKKIEDLISILKPFRDATKILSISHSPTISHTSAVYQAMFDHLEHYLPESTSSRNANQQVCFTPWLQDAANEGFLKLKKYYPTSDGLAYSVSTILDPRYKLTWYRQVGWRKEWIDAARKAITRLWNFLYKKTDDKTSPENDEPKDIDNDNGVSLSLQSILAKQMRGADKTEKHDELRRYLAEPVVNPERLEKEKSGVGVSGALGWWKIHAADYPFLSVMARDFLAISGTGVPVERLFSTGAELVGPYRQRLSATTIKEMVCLKNWIKNEEMRDQLENDYKKALEHKLGLDLDDKIDDDA